MHPELKAVCQARSCPRKCGGIAKLLLRSDMLKETAWEMQKTLQDEAQGSSACEHREDQFPMLDIDSSAVVCTAGQECAKYDAVVKKWINRYAWFQMAGSWEIFVKEPHG